MTSDITVDASEFLRRIFKYTFEGIVVATAAFLIPGRKLNANDIVIIGIIAAATFSMLDLFAPAIGSSVRSGAGLSLGVGLVGGLPTSQVAPALR